ncbi:MAG: glycosyl transferase family 90 [Asticcacaulis sp.]|uniref:glycosyl transferase family 90 n=1 Tax=Asticcacaulis sp. TaxID=1872648 RepID=UPI003F7BF36E
MYQRRIFSAYSREDLAGVLNEVTDAQARGVSISAEFHSEQPSLIKVDFLAGNRIAFSFYEHFESEERRDFFVNRAIACAQMFIVARQNAPDQQGSTRFWVDDVPHGWGLGFCSNSPSHVLVPDSVFFETGGYAYLRENKSIAAPWQDREDKVFWRGASTGLREYLRVSSWREIPRFQLCLIAQALNQPDIYDLGISSVVQIWNEWELREIAESGLLRDEAPQHDFGKYRYSIDIDGNTNSWPGLFTKLLMGITVVKADSFNGYRQWYYDRLIPWKNFVPVAHDMRDLHATIGALREKPGTAYNIALAGLNLAESMTFESELQFAADAVLKSLFPN